MGRQWVTAVSIAAKAFAPGTADLWVLIDYLGDPREAAEKSRYVRAQIDQDIAFLSRLIRVADEHRSNNRIHFCLQTMGDETSLAECPE